MILVSRITVIDLVSTAHPPRCQRAPKIQNHEMVSDIMFSNCWSRRRDAHRVGLKTDPLQILRDCWCAQSVHRTVRGCARNYITVSSAWIFFVQLCTMHAASRCVDNSGHKGCEVRSAYHVPTDSIPSAYVSRTDISFYSCR